MDEQTKTSIVRIYKRQDSKVWPIGCGFLVGDRSILTCGHVVRDALFPENDLSEKDVEIDFPFPHKPNSLNPKLLNAKVIFVVEQPDLAKLELYSNPPEENTPMPLSTEINLWDHPYSAFGITSMHPNGCMDNGKIGGFIADGTIQLVSKSVFKVRNGFSGTAVWDGEIQKAVGMIVQKVTDKTIPAAYMSPMADLFEKCPELNNELKGFLSEQNKIRIRVIFALEDISVIVGEKKLEEVLLKCGNKIIPGLGETSIANLYVFSSHLSNLKFATKCF